MSSAIPGRFLLILIAMAVFAAFFELGQMDVVSDNEGQRTTPPAEMLRSGDLLVPTINGETYLNKPPLLYWAIAGLYAVTGHVSALAARIPTATTFVFLVLAIYFLARRWSGETAARWAALAMLASPYPLQLGRTAELDVPLTLATFLAVVGYWRACNASRTAYAVWLALLSGLAFGAAIMLKGPVPFLFIVPAWIAVLILDGRDPARVIRSGLRWSLVAFGLGLVLFGLQFTGLNLPFPMALALFALVWAGQALRYGGPGRGRATLLLIAVMIVGVLVATPWALAVLNRLHWDYLQGLLKSQVTERTYTASSINGGNPFFYFEQLVGMLAPWSLLLPLQASRSEWQANSGMYRFSVLAGWLSVGVFSLIAGKETEYILPAIPLLLIAMGIHLARYLDGSLADSAAFLSARLRQLTGMAKPLEGLKTKWIRLWIHGLLAVLPVVLVGGLIYAALEENYPALLIELGIFAVFGLGVAVYGWKNPSRRLVAAYVLTLLAVVSGLVLRGYHYTGFESPQTLARLTGRLIEAGYDVEASKVYPAFAFYAGTPIPIETDPGAIHQKLQGQEPYFYLTRKEFIEAATNMPGANSPRILTPSYTNKDLVLIGNTPLPPPVLERLGLSMTP